MSGDVLQFGADFSPQSEQSEWFSPQAVTMYVLSCIEGGRGKSNMSGAVSAHAGIIYYKRIGDRFEGIWTHKDIGGQAAREVVLNVADRSFEGDWPVVIYLPVSDAPFYEGRLTSKPLGEGLLLNWRGARISDGEQLDYEGIGLMIDTDTLVASFEEVSSPLKVDGNQ